MIVVPLSREDKDQALRLILRASNGQGRRDTKVVVDYLRVVNNALAEVAATVNTRNYEARQRLNRALRTATSITQLRAEVIEVSAQLEAGVDEDRAPDTERAPPGYPAPWEGDVAPSTPRGSAAAEEFGV